MRLNVDSAERVAAMYSRDCLLFYWARGELNGAVNVV